MSRIFNQLVLLITEIEPGKNAVHCERSLFDQFVHKKRDTMSPTVATEYWEFLLSVDRKKL